MHLQADDECDYPAVDGRKLLNDLNAPKSHWMSAHILGRQLQLVLKAYLEALGAASMH